MHENMNYSLGFKDVCKKPHKLELERTRQGHCPFENYDTKPTDSRGFFAVLWKAVLIASMFQVQVGCCLGCTDIQVTWRSDNKANNDTCLACIDCPDGLEPSIPCGTVAKHGTHLHCVKCKAGTFSNNYGKDQCQACSLCSKRREVTRNCSAIKNTKCGSCRHGYYWSKHVFDCWLCSVCCGDGKDQVESQCKAQGLPKHRQCQPRHNHVNPCFAGVLTPTSHGAVITNTTSALSKPTRKVPTTKKPALQTSSTQPSTFRSPMTNRKHHNKTTVKNLQTASHSTVESKLKMRTSTTDGNYTKGPSPSNGGNKNKVIITTTVCISLLIAFAVAAKRRKIASSLWWLKCRPICRSKDIESRVSESTVVDEIVTHGGVLLPLKKLKSVSLVSYEKVWKRLDREPDGKKMGKGCYKEVARVFQFAEEDIWELEKELQPKSNGSPSRQLLECLEAKHPRLTVFEFIKVLQGPEVLREDIVIILKEYIYETRIISPVTAKDVYV